MNKKLIAPICTIAAALCLGVGSTWALFTDKSGADVEIAAGQVKLSVSATANFARSRYEDLPPFDAIANAQAISSTHTAVYENGNTADLIASETGKLVTLELDRLTPMDDIEIGLKITNSSNVNIKYRYVVELAGDLLPALEAKLGNDVLDTSDVPSVIYGSWSEVVEPSEVELLNTNLYVAFPNHDGMPGYPEGFDNLFMGKSGSIKISLEAVQGNAKTEDPHETGYGFYDSYLVDEGLESEHWVHEISNVSEFRNIVTNEGNTKSTSEYYPGYEDPSTEFVVLNSIDLGGDLWNGNYDKAANYIFTGTLRGLEGVVLSNYVQTETYPLNSPAIGDDPSMGLFNGSVCATFKDLTLSNFSLDNNGGKVCGLLTAGWSKINQPDILAKTGCEKIAAEEVLFFNCENIVVDNTCSMNISANGGSLIGQARQVQDLTFKNCYSEAYINGNNGANIGGLLGSSSVWSQTAKERTYIFEDCSFAGTITTNGVNIGGLAAQISVNNAITNITVKNCNVSGNLYSYGTNTDNASGIYIAKLSVPSTLSTYPTLDYINDSFTGTFIATLKAKPLSGYNYEMSIESIKDFYNQVIPANLPKVTLGFDQNNKLEVTNKETLSVDYDNVIVQIKAPKRSINIERAKDDEIKNAPYVLYDKQFESLDSMEEATGVNAAYKVTRLGYFLPTVDTPHPTDSKGQTSTFEYFMMDYSHKSEESYSNGYHVDANGAYFIKHNDNASIEYIAFGSGGKNASYFIVLTKDGVPVANGSFTDKENVITPYGA